MTRRARRIVVGFIVPFAMFIALLAWGASSPPGSSPDEDYHMGSIWCATGAVEGRCEIDGTDTVRLLPADLTGASACFAFHPDQSASCNLDENAMAPTERGNWIDNGYPPVFYAVMSTFVSDDLPLSIILMRTFNALLYVGVLSALFFLLPLRMRPTLIWASLIGIVPLGMFLIPSANPSSWAVIQASGLWLAVWGFFEQTGRKKVGLAITATALMVIGAGARGDSAAYGVLAVLIAVALAFRPNRRFAIQLLLPAALIVIAIALFLTAGQSGVLTAETGTPDKPLLSLVLANLQALPQLWIGSLGLWGLGWLDTEMPDLVWGTSFALFAAIAFWGLRSSTSRKWIPILATSAALVAVPLYILVREGILVGVGVQPRYIYPLMIMFVGAMILGARRSTLGLGRVQLLVVGIGLVGANSLALHTNLRRYITGADVSALNLDRAIEWWWDFGPSPMTVWVLGSLAFAAVLGALIWFTWERIPADAKTTSAPLEASAPVG